MWECVWSCLSAPEGISTFANSMRGGMPMPQVGAVGINVSLCLCGVDMCLCSSLWTCFCVFVCVCVCQRGGGGREREEIIRNQPALKHRFILRLLAAPHLPREQPESWKLLAFPGQLSVFS